MRHPVSALWVLLTVVSISFAAVANPVRETAPQKGFLLLQDGISRYVEYAPALPGRPTLVLLNGLVYPIPRWGAFAEDLRARGYGVVSYYFRGQHLTLRKESDGLRVPAFFSSGLDSAILADELRDLLDRLEIDQAVHVVALSYGAHIGAEFARRHPQRVRDLVFLAPLVVSLDRYSPEGQWVLWNLELLKMTWGPFLGPVFYEAAYAQIYRSYLSQRIVPDRVPEEMADRPAIYRESVFHLVRAARDFDLRRYDFAGIQGRVHFLTAGREEAAVLKDQLVSFEKVAAGRRGVVLHFPGSSHAIPDAEGARASRWMTRVMEGDSRIKSGQKYQVTSRGLELWN